MRQDTGSRIAEISFAEGVKPAIQLAKQLATSPTWRAAWRALSRYIINGCGQLVISPSFLASYHPRPCVAEFARIPGPTTNTIIHDIEFGVRIALSLAIVGGRRLANKGRRFRNFFDPRPLIAFPFTQRSIRGNL
jgi:hypothetical protein